MQSPRSRGVSVFARYIMISLEQRKGKDERMLGELFFFFCDKLSDITFGLSFQIIMKAMFESIYAVFQVTQSQIEEFITDFIGRLPQYLQKALAKTSTAV